MKPSHTNILELKTQAKRLRQAMASRGTPLGHSAALELVAQSHGVRDWNTLSAQAGRAAPAADKPPFAVGEPVRGRYLGQPFEGRLLSLTAMAGGFYRVVIHFDQPVDVVTFDSFSAFRRRITAVVDAKGVSPRKTSNGLPHLAIAP